MTSETVMTPITWYCGNRPTVTLANISWPIDVAVVDDDGSYDHNDHIMTMVKISRWRWQYCESRYILTKEWTSARRSWCNPRLLPYFQSYHHHHQNHRALVIFPFSIFVLTIVIFSFFIIIIVATIIRITELIALFKFHSDKSPLQLFNY